jgi:hypothetical protein
MTISGPDVAAAAQGAGRRNCVSDARGSEAGAGWARSAAPDERPSDSMLLGALVKVPGLHRRQICMRACGSRAEFFGVFSATGSASSASRPDPAPYGSISSTEEYRQRLQDMRFDHIGRSLRLPPTTKHLASWRGLPSWSTTCARTGSYRQALSRAARPPQSPSSCRVAAASSRYGVGTGFRSLPAPGPGTTGPLDLECVGADIPHAAVPLRPLEVPRRRLRPRWWPIEPEQRHLLYDGEYDTRCSAWRVFEHLPRPLRNASSMLIAF